MLTLFTPIEELFGIGPTLRRRLKKLGVKTVNDLFFHFPHRYEDFSNLIPIGEVKLNQTCSVRGKILEIESQRTWKRRMIVTTAIIQDNSGAIQVTWFNQPYLTKILKKDDEVLLSGKTAFSKKEGIYLSNPQYEKPDPEKTPTHTSGLISVYPETEGLSSRWLRSIIKRLLLQLNNKLPETLPPQILKENEFLPINKAIWQIHFPDSLKLAEAAKKRFSFEELFYIELFVLRERLKLAKEKAVSIPVKLDTIKDFVESLPFNLTDDQRKSAWQVLKDMEKSRPMNRLLQGDVGSGKTVVAAIATLNVAKAGYQTAFMAPTEILAKQHFKTVFDVLKDFNLSVGLMTGKEDKIYSRKLKNDTIEVSRNKLLKMIKGEINPYTKKLNTKLNILIGTHALIQDKVKFGKLALVVVDEQHRFGVEQRAKLCAQNNQRIIPHLLSMTATPIPRTLALTVYGDLDLSLIIQMPKGRKKIITEIIGPEKREKTYQFIRKEVKKKRQVFVICPRIENKKKKKLESSEDSSAIIGPLPQAEDFNGWSEVKAVEEEYEKLSKNVFPDLKVAMLHGKMKSKEKEKIMKDFKNKKTDILVSTSVVEVGIDIPNATVMMIEGAERFGLAQLHQFRGRVGRAKYQSYCFLLTTSPDQLNRRRLKALVDFDSGFELAEKDLEIRGPGDLSGNRQWGIPDLMMDSLRDLKLVEKTRETAKAILQEDPELKKYPVLQNKLKMFREKIHLE
ncbi:ATP-dependent DNA helicase RecG [Patescibacteria group bacterium]|nr:ATP-dependent DNA helicase RecG [Patescibacteria group bacterium]MBU4367315.1 ATP-dependent DNA helicase RecG [Patescibacteria group bacterium]MBU4461652.1 ATP-dependent DNA helicase RecG [Patescibacteria group bacterium]MCG2699702.1 ATP-dependent DNA helicase RecG [Candidatus Parcubacteria bacterium]